MRYERANMVGDSFTDHLVDTEGVFAFVKQEWKIRRAKKLKQIGRSDNTVIVQEFRLPTVFIEIPTEFYPYAYAQGVRKKHHVQFCLYRDHGVWTFAARISLSVHGADGWYLRLWFYREFPEWAKMEKT